MMMMMMMMMMRAVVFYGPLRGARPYDEASLVGPAGSHTNSDGTNHHARVQNACVKILVTGKGWMVCTRVQPVGAVKSRSRSASHRVCRQP
jgi:hypothetical protein